VGEPWRRTGFRRKWVAFATKFPLYRRNIGVLWGDRFATGGDSAERRLLAADR
jgi:hypothetical protein